MTREAQPRAYGLRSYGAPERFASKRRSRSMNSGLPGGNAKRASSRTKRPSDDHALDNQPTIGLSLATAGRRQLPAGRTRWRGAYSRQGLRTGVSGAADLGLRAQSRGRIFRHSRRPAPTSQMERTGTRPAALIEAVRELSVRTEVAEEDLDGYQIKVVGDLATFLEPTRWG